MLFLIAWKNIWRNRNRSLVVIASVAVGLFAGMFIISFSNGIIIQEIDNAVSTQLAHIQIHDTAFTDEKDITRNIANGPSIVAALRKDPEVKGVTGRAITMGMISSSSLAAGIEIHGIDPDDEKRVSTIAQCITEGAYFDAGKKNEIVVGRKLAERLGVRLHSKIILTFQSLNGELTAGSFRVAGIFHTNNSVFDQSSVYIPFGDLSALLGTGDRLHEIAILLQNGQHSERVAARLKAQYPTLLVETWDEISPEMAMMTSLFDQIMYIVIGIILLALMFGIVNTMLMAVLERQREFGVLMAIGMNRPRVFMMIVYETVILTMAGIPIGMLLTYASVDYLAIHGIDMSVFASGLSQFGVGNIIYPVLDAAMLLPVTVLTAITAVLSSIYPAMKALQFRPATAIHKI